MKRFRQKWLILLALIMMAGCAVRPVKTELPVSHPASPQADSAPFTQPANIFRSDDPLAQTPPAPDASMTHNRSEKPTGKHIDHQKDLMKMKTKPPNVTDMEKTGPEHKEHNQ